jgi:hypothetical protein
VRILERFEAGFGQLHIGHTEFKANIACWIRQLFGNTLHAVIKSKPSPASIPARLEI